MGLASPVRLLKDMRFFFELSGSWLSLYPWSALAEDAELSAIGEGFRGVTLAHNVASKSVVDEVLAQAADSQKTSEGRELVYHLFIHLGSLQLLLSLNTALTRSSPHIFFPARLGFWMKYSFLSEIYLSMAS